MQKKFRKAEPGASGKGEELGYPQEVGCRERRRVNVTEVWFFCNFFVTVTAAYFAVWFQWEHFYVCDITYVYVHMYVCVHILYTS